MKSQHFFRHHRQPQRTTRADSWLCVLRRGLVSIGLMVVSLQIHEPFTPAQDQPERQESVREVTPREITTPSSAPSSANRPALAMPHVLDQILPEVRYLPNDRMELVPVPGDASLEDYLEYLRQRREQSRHAAAMIAVSQVELKGDVERDVARLQARVVVDVAGTERTPQRVALRLNEAALLQVKVSQEEVLFAGRDAEQGYQWWLPGAGRYEFHLTLAVGLRKTNPPRRRLVLSLPASPVNSLRLTMPERDIAPRLLPEDALLEVSTVEGKTEIFATGFGSRLDLSWQSLPLTAHPTVSLDVNTTVLVRGSSEGLFLDATQQVRALQGAFRQLQVQLPPGSELLQLECADLVDSQTDPEHPLEMGISLANPTAGPVTLRWRVRLPAQQGQKVILEGFRVEHAKRQAGSLGLLELEDARWAVSESGEAHLERMSLAEFRSINNGVPVVRAYRFYAQPFRLIVGLEPIPPLFEVQPLLAVMAAEDELRLEARYRVRLYRGRLSQIFLRWPGWQRESWVLEGIEPRGSLVSSFSTSEPGQDDAILIELSPQAPKEWELRLSARRPTRPGSDTLFTLPYFEGAGVTGFAARMALIPALNVDADLQALGETLIQPLTGEQPGERMSSADLGFEPGLKVAQYRLKTQERQFRLRVTPQQERVSVQTTWQARLQGHRLLVQQRLIHRVEYGRVSDFVIMVPEPWSSRMRFFHQGRELQPEWGPGTAAGQVSAWLNVTPVAGEDVVFEVVWSQMLPSSWTGLEPISLKLPILRSGLTPTEDCLAEVESGGWYRGQLQGEGWTLVYEDEERRRWRHAHPALECTLTLSAAEHQPSPRLQIPRAFLRVEWDRSCAQTYWFQASVKSSWSQLLVQLPPESTLEQVWWDDQELTAPHWEAQPVGSSRYVLHVPVNQSESNHLLSLRYHVRGQGRFSGITSLQAVPPELPQAEWSGEVIWELRLPGDQHVWTPPQAAPLYRWKRVGWLWQREPWPEGFDHAAWVKGALTGPVTPPPLAPHHYAYRQLGRAEPLFLRSLSTSLALLCGGSFSLIVGFFSLRGTWMRSLLVVLGALCGLVVVSLWYLAELELLLQPMVWGAVFPLLIGLIESWQRRRRWSAHLLGPRPDSAVSAGRTSDLAATQAAPPPVMVESGTVLRFPAAEGGPTIVRIPLEDSSR